MTALGDARIAETIVLGGAQLRNVVSKGILFLICSVLGLDWPNRNNQ